jgi:hypothetical protein
LGKSFGKLKKTPFLCSRFERKGDKVKDDEELNWSGVRE